MSELLSIILIVSILTIIVGVGAIIFSVITKRPNKTYIRISIIGLILFLISTVGLMMTNSK